uniref:RING-type E3 ubiquitin transferase n=1 Tax=Terrapene triunguis TaxID=2587831 RepID=A0A674JI87_9SAUR
REDSGLLAMAAVHPGKALEDDLACPICLDSFQDPVLLNCGHNFCQACITRVWDGLEENFSCPKCGKRFWERHLHPNPLLGKVVERARQLGWGAEGSMCQKHKERLKLFCKEDQALICVVCDRSKEHRAHRVVPIEEAAQDYKVTGSNAGHLEQSSGAGRGEAHTKAEKQQVVSTFQHLYRRLQEKERLLLKGLGNVAQGVKQLRQENINWLHQRATLLHGLVAELEGKCRLPDAELLKVRGRDTGRERPPTCHPSPPSRAASAPLYFKILHILFILTLDAASAHPGLVVSPDRHSVWHGNSGGCPPSDHRRFFPASCILGSEGFSSGRHRWEVEVGDKDGWAVGVARESVSRRDPRELQPQHGVWGPCYVSTESQRHTAPRKHCEMPGWLTRQELWVRPGHPPWAAGVAGQGMPYPCSTLSPAPASRSSPVAPAQAVSLSQSRRGLGLGWAG